ncbi:TetR/AcrR family transcriptional regulator [Delftia acidovorans]
MSEQAVLAVGAVPTAQAARRGRPSAGRSLSRDQVLDAGLALLEAVGAQGFGLRPLARQLGITPMSVIHHVGDQQELMRSLVERVHGQPLAEPSPGLAPVQRVQALLVGYMDRVRRHPALTVCILGDPALFTDSLAAFTQRLRGEVQQCEPGENEGDAAVLLDLLIDYTHGHALALALSGEGVQALHGRFEQGLARLLR